MKNRIFVILICLVLMLGLFPTTAMAVEIVDSGECGENVTWTLTDDGTLTISGEGEIERYPGHYFEYDEEIFSVVIENGVETISNYAFEKLRMMRSVTIPDSVTVIGEYAFAGCVNLASVEIPNSVINIGHGAFLGCYSLESITIPASVTEIGDDVFGKCDNLKNVKFAEGDQHYSYDDRKVLFNKDKTVLIDAPFDLRGVYIIPDSVIEIGAVAFGGCENLNKIIIPESVHTIGNGAFSSCSNLVEVTIPGSVREIGEYTFMSCKSLTEVTIPEGVTDIGEQAFFECWELTKVTISETVDSIGCIAFSACHKLTEIIVDEDNQHFASEKGVLMNKEKSVLIEMPGGICKYRVPESVTVIGEYAFLNNYGELQELWFEGDAPELLDEFFFPDLIVHYPKNREGWKEIIDNCPVDEVIWKSYTPISTLGWVCIVVAGVVVLGGVGFGTYKLIKKRKSVNVENSDN